MKKYTLKPAFSRFFFYIFFTITIGLILNDPAHSLAQGTGDLRGMITDQATKLPIDAAEIIVNIEDLSYAARTDAFGMYVIDGIVPGSYTLEAHHPGYYSESDTDFQVTADGRHQWNKELTLKEPFFDIFVEVACVTTGMKLGNVPVQITGTLTSNGTTVGRAGKTDDRGFIQFTGLQAGFYNFFINEGTESKPGWGSYSENVGKELTGPHWADVLLKPETSYILASVYGFNPVTEEENVPLEGIVVECEGVHPEDQEIVLVPAQVGVSGINKENEPYWDNTMAGKVKFDGLPQVHLKIRGKRLGYNMAEKLVTALPEDNLTVNMTLQNTALTMVVDTPYHDPEMIEGLEVRLQGLKDSNTEGIDRIRTVKYQADEGRAVVIFDRILPGNYIAKANGTVKRHVPITIEGNDINAGKENAYSEFSVHFTASDYIDAVADTNQIATLFCTPEQVQFSARLMMADELATHDFDFFRSARPAYYPGANQRLEIRASEYYAQFMPEEYHLIEIQTNAVGEFTVTLLPGMYGITAPDLDDYWGHSFVATDQDSGAYRSAMWPYYQVWPHSLLSANAFQASQMMGSITSIGGVALSSGQRLAGTLYTVKNLCALEVIVDQALAWKGPAEHQMVAINRVKSDGTYDDPEIFYSNRLYSQIADWGSVSLTGPVNLSGDMENRGGVARRVFEGLPSGAYTMALHHPRFVHLAEEYAGPYPYQFTFARFPGPGLIPESPFPEDYDYWKSVFPMGVMNMKGIMQASPYGTAKVDIYSWEQVGDELYDYVKINELIPQYIKLSYTGDRIFYYTERWRAGTPNAPYEMWLSLAKGYYFDDNMEHWYHFTSTGGDLAANLYIRGPSPTAEADSLNITHDILVETVDMTDGSTISNVQVSWYNGGSWIEDRVQRNTTGGQWLNDLADPLEFYELDAEHAGWRYNGYQMETLDVSGDKLKFKLIVNMIKGISMKGKVISAGSGSPVPGAEILLWNRYGRSCERGNPTASDGSFTWPFEMGDVGWFLEVKAPGFEPFRKRLDPSMAVADPSDPRTNAYLFEEGNAIALTPIRRPVIAEDSLAMNRRGAFLPGAKKAGNQSLFNAFNADGPLTMTWSLGMGLEQKTYNVTLPGFDNDDGTPGAIQNIVLEEGIGEVWLVDRKSFPDNHYDDEATPLTISEEPEPFQISDFLKKIRSHADGYKNVFFQRITDFQTDSSTPDTIKVTGRVKLWQLPPDLFKPSYIVVTKLGAVNVYNFEYTGAFEGKELTGARLPPWFSGMADIMGSVAGSQAMMGEGLMNSLPKGKIIALPAFTANIILRATNALDYVYAIDTQVKEGMQGKIGGILGLAPGFMGLSLYGGAEATLKGEDREFYLQLKAGIAKKSINQGDYTPGFLKKYGDIKVGLTPPPAGEFYHIDSYKFAPDNKPDELALLYGMSGQTGIEVSASIFPILKYIPKIGPVLFLLYKSGAMDIRALTKGLIGVRSLSGFKTTFPRQEEHYQILGAETKQWRRHFLGGNEVGDPVKAKHPEETESLDIAFGFGVGMDAMVARGSVGAKGTVELSGDDAWTGAPAMLIDVNPNGDSPIIRRIRGDLRAVLEAYLNTWVARFQKKWHWKAWPIDYQFGTEATMKLIEMEIITKRRDLGTFEPVRFQGQDPVIIDLFPPLGLFAGSAPDGDIFIFTDINTDGKMLLKASIQKEDGAWEAPVEISSVEGVLTDAAVIDLADGTRLAVWTGIDRDLMNDFSPPSRMIYSIGNEEGTQWSAPVEIAAIEDVAVNLKLIPHGDSAALIYSRASDMGAAGNSGIYGMLYSGGSWSDPVEIVSSQVVRFDAVGSDDLQRKPSLIAYTNDSHELNAVSWGQGISEPDLLVESAGNAFAFAGGDGLAYLVYSGEANGIGFLEYSEQAGEWTDMGTIFPEAIPRELSIALTEEGAAPILTVAWTQGDGVVTGLYFGAMDISDHEIRSITKLTDMEGDFRAPALQASGPGIIHLMSLYEAPDGVNQLHGYPLTGLIRYGDINDDGVLNLADCIIILKILVSDGPVEIPGKALADVTRTGTIDPADAVYILRNLASE
ncbi:MAG: carboxypeptidase regulatory-like domain-containing protein [Deltaproteobacteria bacterium]|nr:carboxypeptidase regulatory-like domain-containing protein [Deltaproteobacteria bacterium]